MPSSKGRLTLESQSRDSHLRKLPTQLRTADVFPFIDPGFINIRLCATLLGTESYMRLEAAAAQYGGRVSSGHPHVITEAILRECAVRPALSLNEMLQDPVPGTLVCSTETFLRAGNAVYQRERAANKIKPTVTTDLTVVLEYSTANVQASTEKADLARGCRHSFVALVDRVEGSEVFLRPAIMGAPSLAHQRNDSHGDVLHWHGWDFFQVFAEDIDEFSALTTVSADGWEQLRSVPEQKVKESLAQLLGDSARPDWGGELCDHYSFNAHLAGRPVTAAFLLKGPARFAPMTPRMLGKNGDQIYRLSQTPASLLVVQHCHDITEAVHAQLRAFAVAPFRARHYCLIDGRTTWRILRANGLDASAVATAQPSSPARRAR